MCTSPEHLVKKFDTWLVRTGRLQLSQGPLLRMWQTAVVCCSFTAEMLKRACLLLPPSTRHVGKKAGKQGGKNWITVFQLRQELTLAEKEQVTWHIKSPAEKRVLSPHVWCLWGAVGRAATCTVHSHVLKPEGFATSAAHWPTYLCDPVCCCWHLMAQKPRKNLKGEKECYDGGENHHLPTGECRPLAQIEHHSFP